MKFSLLTLLGFVAALVFSYLGVSVTRHFAEAHKILDIPNERSSHTTSVPRGGGIAIVLITLIGVWLFAAWNPAVPYYSLLAYSAGALIISAISWLDDLYSQPNWLRFTVHSAGALLAIYGFGYAPLGNILPGSSWLIEALSVIATFLWIVGLTNAYNFMDGIDGIAGGQGIVAGLGWVLFGALNGQGIVITFGLLLAASTAGFLVHNWPPAKIFMGDVGSAFLGFTLAVLPLISNAHLNQGSRGLRPVLVGIAFVWPFVFDSTFTFLRRLRHGERVFSAHRSHLYQRLVIAGEKHRFVSLLYCCLAALGASLALGLKIGSRDFWLPLMIVLPLLCLGLWIFVTRRERQVRSNLAPYADTV